MRLCISFLLPLAAVSLFVFASEAQSLCGESRTYQQLLRCAGEKNPHLQQAEAQLEVRRSEEKVAGQWRNPDLQVEKFSDTDVMLQIPIDWGGQRSSRRALADRQRGVAEVEQRRAASEGRRELRLKLERWRQIQEELLMISESVETFSQLVRQYESRPSLSAEQKVSLHVFQLARADYLLRRLEQEGERRNLEVYFQGQLGISREKLSQLQIPKIRQWPALKPGAEVQASPVLADLKAEGEVTRATLSLAEAETWPELRLGPSFKIYDRARESESSQWGFNLSLSLPLFNWNQGAREVAQRQIQVVELKTRLAENEWQSRRAMLAEQYDAAVKVLQGSDFSQSMDLRHQQVETLFLRGTVPSSLIVEAHRSLVDFAKARNERLLATLEIYWALQWMDGREEESAL